MANISNPTNMISGMRYDQKFADFGNVSVMYFGDKNRLDLINQNRIASLVNNNSNYLLLSNQQGMFGNSYLRLAGGFLGSAYSVNANLLDNKLSLRIASLQSNNPMLNMLSYNTITNSASGGRLNSLGLANAGNNIQELQIARSTPDNKPSYAFSYGLLQENGIVLGSYGLIDPNVNVQTNYFDIKIVQNLFKDTYSLMNYNIGIVSDAFTGFLTGGDALIAQKLSLGLVQDNVFGGALFFIYTEPNRLISGSVNINGLNESGSTITNGYIDFLQNVIGRNYELGYTYKSTDYSIGFSAIMRTNPYRLDIAQDGLFMFRFNYLI